ncbi:hypothetical protein K501DRAFT_336108 [Backusella circina FSU 941]|nr:hypothetical protein K501DRAFT_336108 [Backusella circina FSU 941]
MPSQTYGESILNSVDFMNLYIKNLDTHVTNDDLSQLFRKYGRIVSARVMTNQSGQSKGYGFVSFAKPEEAAAALQEMNGYILANRPLTVSYHEPKKKLTTTTTTTNNNTMMTTTRPIIYDKPNTNDIVGLGIVDQLGMRDLTISLPKKVNPTPPIPHYHTPYAAPLIARRNSNESVMTEATAKVQRIKLDSAVRRCGHYGRMTEEIVDMLMTLKRKERSLCLFNQEYLREKVQLAADALTTCDSDDDESMDYNRIESKVMMPPPSTPSSMLSVSKSGIKVESLIASFEGKPLHEQKQLLGDQLFPLVKATGTKQAPKVTICLLDTVDLYELASIMYNGPVLKRRVEDAFASIHS